MSSSDLYANTLHTLYKSKTTLLSEDWHESLTSATKQQRIDSSLKLVEVSNAIITLSNTQLSDIVQKMCDQQAALEAVTDKVNAAIQNLEKVQNVLDAITKIIGVVAQIVPLL